MQILKFDDMSSKKERRMEAKKRKVEAFLEVARMNDEDRDRVKAAECPSAKRSKTECEEGEELPKKSPPRLTTKPLLSGESYEVLKARYVQSLINVAFSNHSLLCISRLRERKKLLSRLPDFGLKVVGENASAEIPVTMRTPLLMSDLQTLLMYLMVGDRMPWATTRWCKVGFVRIYRGGKYSN